LRHSNISPEPTTNGFNWAIVRTLWPYFTEFKQRVSLALGCLVLAKFASVGLPFILKYIVDSLDKNNGLESALIAVPVTLILAYGIARLLNVLLGEIRDTLFGRVTERAMRRVGLKVFNHLHELDLDFHLNRQTGGLSRDMERGNSGISFLMRFMIFNIIPTLLEILLVIGLLLYNYGIYFALITLVAITLYIAYTTRATEWRTRYIREANLADSTSNSRAVDSLLNYETVKYFNNESYEANRYDTELGHWEDARRKNRLTLFALNGGQALIIATAMTAMMMLASYGVADGSMTLGDFVLINAFMMQLFMPLNFLGFVYREIKGSLANIEQMFDLLTRKPSVKDDINAPELVVSTGRVCFENVSFNYQKERVILNDVSFTIEPGEKVAVVGESGAGKSTLVKLLFRFYDPISGKVTVDGQDIRHISQASLRQAIGIVPQDTVLFNDTLRENIRYGNTEASEHQIDEAIELAHLSNFIEQLPEGGETKVGERGLKLSGGEKQRVAIARTILKRPPILVFDEATSSLDSGSEKSILEAINSIAEEHTSLSIAHRLSTVIDADKIIVMGQGRILEQGTHQDLLTKQGTYAKLWTMQQEQAK